MRLRADFITLYNHPREGQGEVEVGLFSQVTAREQEGTAYVVPGEVQVEY